MDQLSPSCLSPLQHSTITPVKIGLMMVLQQVFREKTKFWIFSDDMTASCNNSSKEEPAVGIYMKKTFATEEPWMLVCDTSTVILSLV